MIKITDKSSLALITGKDSEGTILMVPLYSPAVADHYVEKFIQDMRWVTLTVMNHNSIIYQR